MATFQQRLKKAMRGGNLRIADLARWLDRPHATVSCWVNDGAQPTGAVLDVEHAEAMLTLLEVLVKNAQGFPVPLMSSRNRKAYLVELRRDVMEVNQ